MKKLRAHISQTYQTRATRISQLRPSARGHIYADMLVHKHHSESYGETKGSGPLGS